MPLSNSHPLHPTAQKLVDAVIEMLEETSYNNIKSENVLARSGISRGPMYHHFENFDDLIETAQTQIYARYAGGAVVAIRSVIAKQIDPWIARNEIGTLLRIKANQSTKILRWQCLGVLHNAASVQNFRYKLWETQEAINQEWIKTYQICLERGWADPSLDPRVFAYMMQSFIMGRVYDDMAPMKIDQEDWVQMGFRLIDVFLFETVKKQAPK